VWHRLSAHDALPHLQRQDSSSGRRHAEHGFEARTMQSPLYRLGCIWPERAPRFSLWNRCVSATRAFGKETPKLLLKFGESRVGAGPDGMVSWIKYHAIAALSGRQRTKAPKGNGSHSKTENWPVAGQ
jgi:hypothetical protein